MSENSESNWKTYAIGAVAAAAAVGASVMIYSTINKSAEKKKKSPTKRRRKKKPTTASTPQAQSKAKEALEASAPPTEAKQEAVKIELKELTNEEIIEIGYRLTSMGEFKAEKLPLIFYTLQSKDKSTYSPESAVAMCQFVSMFHQYQVQDALNKDPSKALGVQRSQHAHNVLCFEVLNGCPEPTDPQTLTALREMTLQTAHHLQDAEKFMGAFNKFIEGDYMKLGEQQLLMAFLMAVNAGNYEVIRNIGAFLLEKDPKAMAQFHENAIKTQDLDFSIMYELLVGPLVDAPNAEIDDMGFGTYKATSIRRTLKTLDTDRDDLRAKLSETQHDSTEEVQPGVPQPPFMELSGVSARMYPRGSLPLFLCGVMDKKHLRTSGYLDVDFNTGQPLFEHTGVRFREDYDLELIATDELTGEQTWSGTYTSVQEASPKFAQIGSATVVYDYVIKLVKVTPP